MSPDNMAEGVEAEERCNNWQEETRKETIRFGMDIRSLTEHASSMRVKQ